MMSGGTGGPGESQPGFFSRNGRGLACAITGSIICAVFGALVYYGHRDGVQKEESHQKKQVEVLQQADPWISRAIDDLVTFDENYNRSKSKDPTKKDKYRIRLLVDEEEIKLARARGITDTVSAFEQGFVDRNGAYSFEIRGDQFVFRYVPADNASCAEDFFVSDLDGDGINSFDLKSNSVGPSDLSRLNERYLTHLRRAKEIIHHRYTHKYDFPRWNMKRFYDGLEQKQ